MLKGWEYPPCFARRRDSQIPSHRKARPRFLSSSHYDLQSLFYAHYVHTLINTTADSTQTSSRFPLNKSTFPRT